MPWKFNPFTGRLDFFEAATGGSTPTGPAGGDLSGSYPDPEVVDDSHDHTAATLPTTIVYDGDAAGGDLSGTYPNPSVVNDSHAHTAATLPATIVYDGDAAGGDLSGTYPNPSVVNDSHDHTAATLPSTIVYDGDTAGGDLSGTYPNPSVVNDSHNHTASTLPATIVYDGDAAGGDLSGTYPNPTVVDANIDHGSIGGLTDDDHVAYARLTGRGAGQVLQGAVDAGGGLVLEGTAHATPGPVHVVYRLGVNMPGLAAPECQLHIDAEEDPDVQVTVLFETHNDNQMPSSTFAFRRSGGTHAAPTEVTTGFGLGNIFWAAHDGTDWHDTAAIETYATADWSLGAFSSTMHFFTTRAGETTPETWMEMDDIVTMRQSLFLTDSSGTASELRLGEPSGGGVSYAALRAPALGTSYTLTMPTFKGNVFDVIMSDGGTPAQLFFVPQLTVPISGVSNTDYTVLTTDVVVVYVSISAARVVNLPAVATMGNRIIYIMDISGSCSVVNTITIDGNGGETINGAATRVLNAAYAKVALLGINGLGWYVIGD